MKRIRVVMSKVFTKTKTVGVSPAAAATIIAVCTVVGTIPVPGVQTVCTGITEFIKMMEGAHANDEQWTALLDVMQRYAKRLENFADSVSHNQPDNYLVDSQDKVAVDAREAIEEFTKQITDAQTKIEAKRNEGKMKKHLGASAIKDEIRECRQALADALEDFNGRVNNIIVRSTVKSVEITVKPEPYDIPGAKPIQNGDFRIVQDIDWPQTRYWETETGTFWENLRSVDLGNNQNLVAKIYVTKNSKEKFKKDMEFFADNLGPRIARLFGYNAESRHPYMIFSFASVRPMMRYLIDRSREDYSGYLIEGWKLFQDLQKAGKFLCDQSGDMDRDFRFVEASINDAAVGSHGQLVLAPPHEVPYRRVKLDEGHTEYIIDQYWVRGTAVGRQEQHIRAIRPFTLALRKNAQKFLEYDTHRLASPSQVPTALRQLWPDVTERQMMTERYPYPEGVTAGDVGVLGVGEDGEIHFQYLTNIADAFGGIVFSPPLGAESVAPRTYRETCYNKIEGPTHPWWSPTIYWAYMLDESQVTATVLARQFKIIGKRYGVRPSSLAMTRYAKYRLQSTHCDPMRSKLQTGNPIHCYVYFDDMAQFQSARWSFHSQPPSEEEAAAEVSVLESFNCPELWAPTRSWAGLPYWQLEDEDFEFYLKNSGDEEEIARIEDAEETGGSPLRKARLMTSEGPIEFS
ncbi:hypothetical protein FRC00_000227 [Tulasnella sp. 408]|nr:hypothetical protein FRC00_000227 [Tulasnella sp. 408]